MNLLRLASICWCLVMSTRALPHVMPRDDGATERESSQPLWSSGGDMLKIGVPSGLLGYGIAKLQDASFKAKAKEDNERLRLRICYKAMIDNTIPRPDQTPEQHADESWDQCLTKLKISFDSKAAQDGRPAMVTKNRARTGQAPQSNQEVINPDIEPEASQFSVDPALGAAAPILGVATAVGSVANGALSFIPQVLEWGQNLDGQGFGA